MELIPINESKLKIMLDESDMRQYNITDEADCANSETRLAIRNILDRAKDQIGFNTEGSEIFVQLYTSKGGGCELFVTKSTLTASSIVASTYSPEKKKKKWNDTHTQKSPSDTRALPARTQTAQKPKRIELKRMIYSFDSLSSLCKVCKIAEKTELTVESSVYKGFNDIYYLVLEGDGVKEYSRLDSFTFILEFGERLKGIDTLDYLIEHTKPVCASNAISILAQF